MSASQRRKGAFKRDPRVLEPPLLLFHLKDVTEIHIPEIWHGGYWRYVSPLFVNETKAIQSITFMRRTKDEFVSGPLTIGPGQRFMVRGRGWR